jgi:nucleotide-binding universal stress UspA family protein
VWFDAVVAGASRVGCELIVLPAHEGKEGAIVTKIVATTAVPVLVARRAGPSARVVVATDLRDPRTPVLKRGAELATRLDAPVTFLHNVPPLPPEVPMALGLHIPGDDDLPTEALLVRQMERLRERARSLAPSAEAVVLSKSSTASAILDASREREADLVVVGTRPRSWLRTVATPSVARRVVEDASRSVLVVPIS